MFFVWAGDYKMVWAQEHRMTIYICHSDFTDIDLNNPIEVAGNKHRVKEKYLLCPKFPPTTS